MTDSDADAWGTYWRTSSEGGCFPGAPALRKAIARIWSQFAAQLPPRATLLDLATGGGAVPHMISHARPDIIITGVDYANIRPDDRPGTVVSGIDCSAMPFADASFDAVTSQFGVEYCSIEALREAARILAPNGRLLFIIHDVDSVTVRQSQARLAAIMALVNAGLIAGARRISAGLGEDPVAAAAIAQARRLHPGQSIAEELPQALGLAIRNANARIAIDRIEADTQREMRRLRAMALAARDAAGLKDVADSLASAGIACVAGAVEAQTAGRIAWTITGTRAPHAA